MNTQSIQSKNMYGLGERGGGGGQFSLLPFGAIAKMAPPQRQNKRALPSGCRAHDARKNGALFTFFRNVSICAIENLEF